VPDFIDQLQVSQEEKDKLRALGAKSPLGVLSLRKASQEAFDRHFGADRANAITEELRSLLTTDELRQLNQPVRPPGSLGARLDPQPKRTAPGGAQKNKA